MRVLNRFASWFRSLFHSDDIPLRVLLPDGRMLYDKHPLVRHGLVTSLKHDRSLVYVQPIPHRRWEDPDAPPIYVGQEYFYLPDMANKELSPIAEVEARHGFFQDEEFGVDYRKMVGPAWRRHIHPSTIFWSICLTISAAIFLYANIRNDFEGFRQLASWGMHLVTWTPGWAKVVFSFLPEGPHWLIEAVVDAALRVLFAGLATLAWFGLRRFRRRKPKWWEPPSDR